jgi:hypothetical protein
MMSRYQELISEHHILQEQVTEQPDAVDVKQTLQLIAQVRDAGATTRDPQQRERLRSILKHWGAYVYERSGEYPRTQLAPYEPRNAPTEVPIPREEGFCEKHGPYDASLGRCPYCVQESDPPPPPPPPDQVACKEEETDFGFRARLHAEEENFTQLPERRRGYEDVDETVAERAAEGMLGFLIVKEGMRRGQVHRVHHGTTIGRDRAKIVVRDPKVSKPHAKFTIEDDQFIIWDFGSENGTFVNGERIRGATVVNENDLIKIGDTVFVLKILG